MAKKIVWRIYGIATSVALAVAGILLMLACYGVYSSGGEQIYTAEKIAVAFAPISVPLLLALFMALGGLVLHLFMPLEEKKTADKNYSHFLYCGSTCAGNGTSNCGCFIHA